MVYEFLQMLYQEFQSYSKTSQWIQRKERVEIERRISKGIQIIEREDYKSTGTCSTQKRRKIQSRNRHIKTCYWRSFIPEIERKMKTNCIFIKNNAGSQEKLQDIWQRTIIHSRSLNKMETIFIGLY